MTIASVALPRVLRIGGGASAEIGATLVQLGLSRPLVVSDSYLEGAGVVARIEAAIRAAGIADVRSFCGTVPEPTSASIDAGIAFLNAGDHDCVIGLGGGSPIDSAKAIAVFGPLGGMAQDYRAPHQQDRGGLPVIAIPTTAGTGSEATRFTVITDEATSEKLLCAGLAYLPVAALVDYELTLTAPPRLTADTGIDALTHAIEAYVSRRANPFSDLMALQAMRAITPNLRAVCADPGDHSAREAIMLGACYAGIAFSNASVALVHGMSRPIGAHFHVPHGLSNAMLLPLVTEYSAPFALSRYAACAAAIGVTEGGEGEQGAVARLVEELHALNRDLQVPSPRRYGIAREAWDALLDTMAAQALASGSPQNNPVVPDAAQIRALYVRAYA